MVLLLIYRLIMLILVMTLKASGLRPRSSCRYWIQLCPSMLVLSFMCFAEFGEDYCNPASLRLVFTQSSLVEQSTPISHQIYDAVSSVSGRGVSDGRLRRCRAPWGGL